MKKFKFLKYFLMIALGATLFFSCSKDEIGQDELGTFDSTEVETRMAPDCEIEICVEITPNTTNSYPDIYIVEIPGVGEITIQNGVVTLPNGSTQPLPADGIFCSDIPVYGSIAATVFFKGYGGAVTTATWADGTECEIFSANGNPGGVSTSQDIELDCDPICGPTPDCEIEICVEITPNTTNSYPDIYIVEIPGVGEITIQNGVVTLPNGSTQPLPADGIFCSDIPVFGSIAATVFFKGYGAAVTTATWADGTECEIFSAGVGTTAGVSMSQDVELTCDPICDPVCTVEICVDITPNTTNSYPDIYQVTLPGGGLIKIQNGIVTLPDGSTQPLVNNTFCAEIEIPVGGSLTAELLFKGYGAAVTKGIWPGTSCLLFSAGVGTTSGVLLIEEVTLECDPPC